MSKNIFVTAILILFLVIMFWMIVRNVVNGTGSLLNPMGKLVTQSVVPSPTLLPSPIPKTFKFDGSTDLKKELDSINPQVLDSDFE